MAQYLPRFMDGDQLPLTASATIAGGQLVTVAGAVAGDAATNCAGVAGFDVVSGQVVTVFREGIHLGTASGTIALGAPLCAAANGQVRAWVSGTDNVAAYIGRAWSAATNGQSVTYALYGV